MAIEGKMKVTYMNKELIDSMFFKETWKEKLLRVLAKWFGKKTVGLDVTTECTSTTVAYTLFGKTYVTEQWNDFHNSEEQ